MNGAVFVPSPEWPIHLSNFGGLSIHTEMALSANCRTKRQAYFFFFFFFFFLWKEGRGNNLGTQPFIDRGECRLTLPDNRKLSPHARIAHVVRKYPAAKEIVYT
jgi:hypothetical protein